MKQDIVVIGLGTFGYELSTQLFKNGHNVLVVDSNEKKINQIKDQVTVAVTADISDYDVLDELEISKFKTIIIGMSTNFEPVILGITHLKKKGAKHIIAKANSHIQKEVLLKIGADEVILPEREIANRLVHRLISPNIIDSFKVDKHISLVNIKIPKKLADKSLKELDLRNKYNITALIAKYENVSKIIYNPDIIFKEGDEIYVAGEEEDILKMLK